MTDKNECTLTNSLDSVSSSLEQINLSMGSSIATVKNNSGAVDISAKQTNKEQTAKTSVGSKCDKDEENQNLTTELFMIPKTRTKTIVIEGNIGCGKSTVLNKLRNFPDVYDVVVEPIGEWTNVDGHNLLDLLYSDPKRWSFAFQSFAQMSLAKLHRFPSNKRFKIMERSIFSARYCFTENFKRQNLIHDAEYELLHRFFEQMVDIGDSHVDLFIYLESNPESCLDRVRIRNRPEEQTTVDLPFLMAIHDLYDEWLVKKSPYKPNAPVVIVDGNQSSEEVYEAIIEHLDKLVSIE